jgi:hypothetical protein
VKAPGPHPFVADPELPPDMNGRRVCRCGLVGRPGDAHHDTADVDAEQHAARLRADPHDE